MSNIIDGAFHQFVVNRGSSLLRLNVDNELNRFTGRRSNSVKNNIESDKPFKRAVRLSMFAFDVESIIKRDGVNSSGRGALYIFAQYLVGKNQRIRIRCASKYERE